MASWIFPKNERNSLSWAPSVLRIVSFIRFLEEYRTSIFSSRFTALYPSPRNLFFEGSILDWCFSKFLVEVWLLNMQCKKVSLFESFDGHLFAKNVLTYSYCNFLETHDNTGSVLIGAILKTPGLTNIVECCNNGPALPCPNCTVGSLQSDRGCPTGLTWPHFWITVKYS